MTAICLNTVARSRLIEEIASCAVCTVTLRWFTTAACHSASVHVIRLYDANDRYRWEVKVAIEARGIVPLNETYLDANPACTIAARCVTEKQIRLFRERLISFRARDKESLNNSKRETSTSDYSFIRIRLLIFFGTRVNYRACSMFFSSRH